MNFVKHSTASISVKLYFFALRQLSYSDLMNDSE